MSIDLNYEYIYQPVDMQRVMNWLEDKKYVVVDTETTGLSPFKDDIVLCQIGNEEKQWLIDKRTVDLSPLQAVISDPEVLKLGQFFKFDIKMLSVKYGMTFKNVGCTQVAEHVIRSGLYAPADMGALAKRYLGIEIDKDEELRTSFKHTAVNAFSDRQLQYAAGDCVYPVFIARHQRKVVQQKGLRNTLALEFKVLPVLAAMELAGMRLNESAWLSLYQEALAERVQIETQLDSIFGISPTWQTDVFAEDKVYRKLDYNSPAQMRQALANLGFDLPNTNKDTILLAAIEGQLPVEIAQAILSYRMLFTKTSRYGVSFIEGIESQTGRVHSDFRQMVATGRLASGKDKAAEGEEGRKNLQNVLNDARYRGCFVPGEGNTYLVYDLQAIEPRILGEMSSDPTYLYAFDNKKDIYGIVGSRIYKVAVSKKTPDLRNKTKIVVLGNTYGTGKNKFHRKMLTDVNFINGVIQTPINYITREESDELWEKFFEICPKIKKTLDELSSMADPINSKRRLYDQFKADEPEQLVKDRVYGILAEERKRLPKSEIYKLAVQTAQRRGFLTYAESLGGRKRFLSTYHRTWWTEGRNTPIQSTAADIVKQMMVDVSEKIERNGHAAFLVNQVHDEIVVECKRSEAEEVDCYVKETIVGAGQKYLKRVPVVVEGGIKPRWEKD